MEGDGEVDAGHDATDPGGDEGEGEGADDRGPHGTDDGAEDEAAHLRRGIEPERFAALVVLGLVDDRAARGRVVHRDPDARDEAPDEELQRAMEKEGQERAGRQHGQPHEHQARREVRSASQPKTGSKISRAAGQAARMMPRVVVSTPCSTT